MATVPLLLALEFVRVEQAGDAYAFRFTRQEYLLRREGGGFESAWFPWDEALLSDLSALRLPHRDPLVAARLGEVLRHFLKPMGWAQKEAELIAAVNEGRPVLLTIRSAAAELYALPWELLRVTASGQHLGELGGVLLRYEWPETRSIPEETTQDGGGAILFAWSVRGGPAPVREQLAAIQRASQAGFYPFDPEQDVVGHASCGRLSQALQRASEAGRPVSVLHLLCHGSASGATFGLLLDSDLPGEAGALVDGGRLRQLLLPHAKSLRLVVLSACDSGNIGALGNQLGSIAQNLHRGGIAAVVGSRYPLSVAGSIKLTEVFYGALLVRPTSVETALLAARTALAESAASLDWASLQLYARAEDGPDTRPLAIRPYRGLLAFQPEHTRFFFGRDAERRAVLTKLAALRALQRPRFLIVAGASGTGKSSVVRSGVIPDILSRNLDATGPAWQVAVMRPGEDPLAALSSALDARVGLTPPLLLIVDQFEEVFTHTRELAVRRQFTARLWALSREDSGIDCILTLRVDFLGQCGELILDESGLRLDRVCYDEAHRVFVAQLGPVQLRAAIEGPVERVGLELSPGLATRMIDEVQGEPGALPLLSYTLDLLWQKRRGRLLSAHSYAELGGVIGALEGRANAVLAALGPAEQAQARRILVRLVGFGEGASDSRRRLALRTLRTLEQGRQASFDTVLSAFVDTRLLVLGEEQGQVTLEVAHEALIRKWAQLREWIDKDREKLAELNEVERWVAQWRSYGSLLREAQLGYAARVLEKHGEDMSPDGRELVAASQRAEEGLRARELAEVEQRAGQEARVARRLRLAALILALALVGAMVAMAVAWRKNREAKEQFLSLLEEQGRQRMLGADPMRAIVYLSKAYEEGSRGPATRYLLASAAEATIDMQRIMLIGHSAPVKAAVYSPDGRLILTASDDHSARLWDARSGRLLRVLLGHAGPVEAIAFSPDGTLIATASDDRTVRLWDSASGQVRLTLFGHGDKVFAVAFSPDGSQLLTASRDQSARLWDPKSGALRFLFSAHSDQVNSARFSPDGKRILTASSDKTAKLWDAASGQTLLTIAGHSARVSSAALSPDGTRIITTSQDKSAKLWDSASGRLLKTLHHEDSVEDAAFSPEGSRVVTASLDQTAKLWDVSQGRELLTLSGHSNWLHAVSFSPDGQRVVTASRDHSARIWDVTNCPLVLFGSEPLYAASFSPDGTRIVTGGADRTAQTFETRSGKRLMTFSGHTDRVFSASYSPDGTRIVTASGDGTARVFDEKSGQPQLLLGGHPDKVHAAAYRPDGARIVTASYDGKVRIFDARSGALVLLLEAHRDRLHSASFAPDGTRIVTASADKLARVWDATSGQLLLTLAGHTDDVYSAAFSPDGKRLVTASFDKTARLWDAGSGSLLAILAGHADKVLSAAFSPEGAWVLTASFDRTARLWDGQSGKMILGLVGHSDWVNSAVFSPSGLHVLTASGDKTARMFKVAPESRAPEVITAGVRCLIPYRFVNEQVIPSTVDTAACSVIGPRQ